MKSIHCSSSHTAVAAERAFLGALGGGCEVPIAAGCVKYGLHLRLKGIVVSADGSKMVKGDITGASKDPVALGKKLAEELLQKGADMLLKELAQDTVFPGM